MSDKEKAVLDAEVERSTGNCPGGRGCECCAPDCDCGCRNECPRFRYVVLLRIRERERFNQD